MCEEDMSQEAFALNAIARQISNLGNAGVMSPLGDEVGAIKNHTMEMRECVDGLSGAVRVHAAAVSEVASAIRAVATSIDRKMFR